MIKWFSGSAHLRVGLLPYGIVRRGARCICTHVTRDHIRIYALFNTTHSINSHTDWKQPSYTSPAIQPAAGDTNATMEKHLDAPSRDVLLVAWCSKYAQTRTANAESLLRLYNIYQLHWCFVLYERYNTMAKCAMHGLGHANHCKNERTGH